MSGLKKKEKALGLTDKDCVWAPFSYIAESYEKDVLTGKAYPKIGPAFVEDKRFCWLQDYKWPKYDKDNKIIGLKVISYEITDKSISNALSLFTKKNSFGIDDYNIEQPIEDKLSKKEKEVLFYLCHGLSVKRIA